MTHAFHCIVPSEIADMSRFAEGVRIDPDVFGALVESLERRMFCSTISHWESFRWNRLAAGLAHCAGQMASAWVILKIS